MMLNLVFYLFIFIDGAFAAGTGNTVAVLSASTTETSEMQRLQALELSENMPSVLTQSVIVYALAFIDFSVS